jgi:hypothetical protein
MGPCSRRWGKGHLFSPAEHLEPIAFRQPGLIGLGLLAHQFRVEDGTQPRLESCTLRRVRRVGAEIGQFLGICFKVEELGRRADTVNVLMPQLAQHVERVGAVGMKFRQHGPVFRRPAGEVQPARMEGADDPGRQA